MIGRVTAALVALSAVVLGAQQRPSQRLVWDHDGVGVTRYDLCAYSHATGTRCSSTGLTTSASVDALVGDWVVYVQACRGEALCAPTPPTRLSCSSTTGCVVLDPPAVDDRPGRPLSLRLVEVDPSRVPVTFGDNSGAEYPGTDDVKLKEIAPDTNFVSADLETHRWGRGDYGHSLLRFTGLSEIKGPVTVTSAEIRLYLRAGLGGGDHAIAARRVLRPWTEHQATWRASTGTTSWQAAGGLGALDLSAVVSATGLVGPTVGRYYSVTGPQLLADVQQIINGIAPNEGWLLLRTDTGPELQYRTFVQSEGPDGQRPLLIVTYQLTIRE